MDLIESYREELQLIRKPWTRVWVGLLVLVLLLLPWYAPEHVTYIATHHLYLRDRRPGSEPADRLHRPDLLRPGRLSGHRGLHLRPPEPDRACPGPWALLGAGVAAGLFGVLVGFPSLRLKGPYLAIATMGFGIAVYQIFVNSELLSGGRMGLSIKKLSPLLGLSQITVQLLFQFPDRRRLHPADHTTSSPPTWGGPSSPSATTTSPPRSSA